MKGRILSNDGFIVLGQSIFFWTILDDWKHEYQHKVKCTVCASAYSNKSEWFLAIMVIFRI